MDLNKCPECGSDSLKQDRAYGGRKVECGECEYREPLEDFLKSHSE